MEYDTIQVFKIPQEIACDLQPNIHAALVMLFSNNPWFDEKKVQWMKLSNGIYLSLKLLGDSIGLRNRQDCFDCKLFVASEVKGPSCRDEVLVVASPKSFLSSKNLYFLRLDPGLKLLFQDCSQVYLEEKSRQRLLDAKFCLEYPDAAWYPNEKENPLLWERQKRNSILAMTPLTDFIAQEFEGEFSTSDSKQAKRKPENEESTHESLRKLSVDSDERSTAFSPSSLLHSSYLFHQDPQLQVLHPPQAQQFPYSSISPDQHQ